MPTLNLIFPVGQQSSLWMRSLASSGGCDCQMRRTFGSNVDQFPPPSPLHATQSTCATPAASNPVGGGGIYTQIAINPGVYGKRDPSGLTVFGFSQEGQNSSPPIPQVLEMSPNIVSRAWQRWGSRRSSVLRLQIRLSQCRRKRRHHVHRRNNSHCSLQGRVSRQSRHSMQ